MEIPGFDPARAKAFVLEYPDPKVRDFVTLLYLRDIEGLDIADSVFLAQQEKLLPHLEGTWRWLAQNSRRIYALGEAVAFFGYLGLNGTLIPQLVETIDFTFRALPQDDGVFNASGGRKPKCANTAFLNGVLALGFTEHPAVKTACFDYLSFIEGAEGECPVRTDETPCAYVMVKTLHWLNKFPTNWRTSQYQRVLENVQNFLLFYNLSEADFPRSRPRPNTNWFKFGYFRSFQASIFEAAEALAVSGVKRHPELSKTLRVIGDRCVDGVTWKPQYIRKVWPLQLETRQRGKGTGSPWLTLRGLRITKG
ncbi:MAG: hypothetical protein ACFFCO_03915 [Promethearchaeota archaeon]